MNLKIYQNLNKRKQRIYNLLIFLLSPFFTIIYLIRNFSKISNPKILIILLSGFIGFAYFVSPGGDINRYIQFFQDYNKSLSQLTYEIFYGYGQDSKNLDYYLDFISLILKPITNNVNVFLITLGLKFGVFYSKYLLTILDSIENVNFITGVFIFIFIIAINPQLGINSRFYAASACSLAGFYSYFLENKKSGLLLILLSVFIHFGVVGFIILYVVFYLLKNKPLITLIIALASFVISGIDLSSFASSFANIGFLGVSQKLESYTGEGMQNRFELRFGEEAIWFMKYRARFFFSSALILLSYFYFTKVKITDIRTRYLFVAALLAVAFWNLTNSFPMVYRYEPLLVIVIASFFVHFNGNFILTRKQKLVQYLIIPLLIIYPIISFRTFLGAIPVHFFISNPIVEGFLESSKDIYTLLMP